MLIDESKAMQIYENINKSEPVELDEGVELQDVTGEQVRDAMIKANIDKVDHHKCGICKATVYFSRIGDQLYFNSGCICSYSPPEPRSWDDAAEWINMQSNKEWRLKLMQNFGLK